MRPLRHDPRLLRRQLILLLLLFACDGRGPAELYRDALRAETWEEGSALCRRLPEEDAPDCLVAVQEALGRLDRADCDAIPAGVWRDECVFLYAERVAAAGDAAAGFAACEGTRFGRHCTYHLIREGARAALERPLAEAAVATDAYAGLRLAPDAGRLFWQTWFRERMSRNHPVDPSGCGALPRGVEACHQGALDTIELSLQGMARARGHSFCKGPPPDGHAGERTLWVRTPETEAWVAAFVARACPRPPGEPERGGAAGEVAPG